ncbi:MAG: hypothetical protein OXT67_10210 [Zetaproteobacteria bacterium]|nr:hypothetical protein [Zetaproteobacteria bacterium]
MSRYFILFFLCFLTHHAVASGSGHKHFLNKYVVKNGWLHSPGKNIRKNVPMQGFKIHVSCPLDRAKRERMLQVILPTLPVPHKVNMDFRQYEDKIRQDSTNAGKCITVYPTYDIPAAELVTQINHAFTEMEGNVNVLEAWEFPKISGDHMVNPAVFLRYGQFYNIHHTGVHDLARVDSQDLLSHFNPSGELQPVKFSFAFNLSGLEGCLPMRKWVKENETMSLNELSKMVQKLNRYALDDLYRILRQKKIFDLDSRARSHPSWLSTTHTRLLSEPDAK